MADEKSKSQDLERQKTISRQNASRRERIRVHELNNALEDLSALLPWKTHEGVPTKHRIIAKAIDYIKTLTEALEEQQHQLNGLKENGPPPS